MFNTFSKVYNKLKIEKVHEVVKRMRLTTHAFIYILKSTLSTVQKRNSIF